jgi:hypothetical protein
MGRVLFFRPSTEGLTIMYRVQDKGTHIAVIEVFSDGTESAVATTNSTTLAESLAALLEQQDAEAREALNSAVSEALFAETLADLESGDWRNWNWRPEFRDWER